ncbi:MAG: Ig-like domain-containing protein [archaeon]
MNLRLLAFFLLFFAVALDAEAINGAINWTDQGARTKTVDFGSGPGFRVAAIAIPSSMPIGISVKMYSQQGALLKTYMDETSYSWISNTYTAAEADYYTSGEYHILMSAIDASGMAINGWLKLVVREAAPLSSRIPNIQLDEDTFGTIDLKNYFSDPDYDTLTYGKSATSNVGITITNGVATITPNADWNGAETVTFSASDGTYTNYSNQVTITVLPVNDAPVAVDDSITVPEDGSHTSNFALNDLDVDGDALSITSYTQGQHGAVTKPDTRLKYTPNQNYNGLDSFTYAVSDGHGGTDVGTVSVNVTPVNDAPVISGINDQTIAEGGSFTNVSLDAKVSDADNPDSELMWSITGNTELSVIVSHRRVGIYAPNADWFGSEQITFTVEDPEGLTDSVTVTYNVTSVNDAPVVSNIPNRVIPEDGNFQNINLDNYVTDADHSDSQISWTYSGNTHLSVGIVNRIATIVSPANWSGAETVSFTATDPDGLSDSDPATFTVTAVNDAPGLSDIPGETIAEDANFTAIPLDNYVFDVDNDDSQISWTFSGNTGLSVSILNRVAMISAPADWNGAETITFTATDRGGLSRSDPATFAVTPVNDAPVANDDWVTLNESQPKTIMPLANDNDADGDSLSILSLGTWSVGSVSSPDGQRLTLIPRPQYTGTSTFAYTITDGHGGTDTATVHVTIVNVNDPPVVYPIGNQSIAEGGSFTVINLDAKVYDSDNADSEIAWTTSGQTELAVTISASRVASIATPDSYWHGSEEITFTATDPGGLSGSRKARFTVTSVNDAPVAHDFYTTCAEDTFTSDNVVLNDEDADGDSLSVESFTQPSNGAVIQDGSNLKYTPNPNYFGNDSYTYIVTDGNGGTDTANVYVNVRPVNDAPVAVDDARTVAEDHTTYVTVLSNDYDVDGDTLSVLNFTQAGHGAVSRYSSSNLLVYRPNTDYAGADSFTYTASDGHGGLAIGTVTVTVTSVNDAPVVASPGNQTTNEHGSFDVIDLDDYVADPDNPDDQMNWAITGNVNLVVSVTSRRVTITAANPRWSGSETLVFTATDPGGLSDSASAVYTITPVNDAPVVSDIPDQGIPEGGDFALFNLSDYVDDPDNADSEISWTFWGAGDLSVEIVNNVVNVSAPDDDWSGSATITFTAEDPGGLRNSDSATFTVRSENDPPQATDDASSVKEDHAAFIDVVANDEDADGDSLRVYSVTQPQHGSASLYPDPNIAVYTPDNNFYGEDSFTYTVTDGFGAFDTATVTVTVNPVNDAPVVADIPPQTIAEHGAFVVFDLDDYVDDADNSDSEMTWNVTGNSSLEVVLTGTSVSVGHPAEWSGSETITFTATDPGGLSDSDSAVFAVTAENDPPVAEDDYWSVWEDSTAYMNVLRNDHDPEGDTISLESFTQPHHGAAVLHTDGRTIRYMPDHDYFGKDNLTYTISDSHGATASAMVYITVLASNDAPAVDDIPDQAVDEGTGFNAISLSDYVDDPDHPDSQITWTVAGNSSLRVRILGTYAQVTAPDAEWNGAETIIFTATDPDGQSGSDAATFTVRPVNDAPHIINIENQTRTEGEAFSPIILNNYVSDPDNTVDELNWTFSGSSELMVSISDDVLWVLYLNGWKGAETLNLTVRDPDGAWDSTEVTFTVTSESAAPVVSGIADQRKLEGGSFDPIYLDDHVSDPDNSDSEMTWSYSGNSALSVDITNRVARVTAPATWSGSEIITFTATDPGGLSDSDSASFTMVEQNEPPVVSGISDQRKFIGGSFDAINLDNHVYDADDADELMTWTYSGNADLSVVIENRIATISAPPNWSSSEEITFTATDPGGLSDSDSANFTMEEQNDPPIVNVPDFSWPAGFWGSQIDLHRYVSDDHSAFEDLIINVTEHETAMQCEYEYNGPGIITCWQVSGGVGYVFNVSVSVIDELGARAEDSFQISTYPSQQSCTPNWQTGSWGPCQTNDQEYRTVWDANNCGTNDGKPATSQVCDYNYAPVVSDIPDQTILEGASFTTITLDDYVEDPDHADSELSWQASGAIDLTVSITNRVATISIPNTDWRGSETIAFTARDPSGQTDSDSATFEVRSVNYLPVVSDIPDQTVDSGHNFAAIALDDFVSDADHPDSQITWSAAGAASITVSISGRVATLSYPAGWLGSETITFTATDPEGGSGSDAATFTVADLNDLPVVSDIPDQTVMEGGTFATITLDEYVADGDHADSEISWSSSATIDLTISIVNRVATISIPNPDWHGSETITFTATDPEGASGSDSAVFTVTSVNDPPVVSDIPDQAVDVGQAFASITLDDYVSDADHADSQISWSTSGGSSLTVSIVNRVASISAPGGWLGSEIITFTATDPEGASGSDAAAFTVAFINDPPAVSGIVDQVIPEGGTFTDLFLDDYVRDPDHSDSELAWTATGAGELSVSIVNHVATINIPNPDWHGSETITFTATDPVGASGSDSAVFTVTSVNDPPVVSDIPNQVIPEGGAFAAIILDDYVTDADHADSQIAWSATGAAALAVSIVGRVAAVSTPNTDWHGSETITFTAADPEGGTSSDSAVFSVTSVNDPPVVSGIPDQVLDEGEVFASLTLDDYVSDADHSDSEMVWSATGSGEFAVSIVNRVATITAPHVNWHGSETITFTAKDPEGDTGQDQAVFALNSVNDAPVINSYVPADLSLTVAEGGSISFSVSASDIDGDALSYEWRLDGNLVGIGASYEYSPGYSAQGTHTLVVTVSDGSAAAAVTWQITVTDVNQKPSFTSTPVWLGTENQLYSYDADAVDPDGNVLTYSLVQHPIGMIIDAADGQILWTPTFEQAGVHAVSVKASDGGLYATQDYTLTIGDVNRGPSILSQPILQAVEGQEYFYDVNAADDDADPIYYALAAAPDGMAINSETGLIRWLPDYEDVGFHAVTVTATDGKTTIGQSYALTVIESESLAKRRVEDAKGSIRITSFSYPEYNIQPGGTLDMAVTLYNDYKVDLDRVKVMVSIADFGDRHSVVTDLPARSSKSVRLALDVPDFVRPGEEYLLMLTVSSEGRGYRRLYRPIVI